MQGSDSWCGTRSPRTTRPVKEDCKETDDNESPGHRPVQTIDGQHRCRHKNEIEVIGECLLAEAHDGEEDEADSGCRDPLESCGRPIVISVETVEDSNHVHEYTAGKTDSDNRGD